MRTVPHSFEKEIPPQFPPKPKLREEESVQIREVFIELDHPDASPIFEETDEELEKEVQTLGTDALAWYQPFHFYERWGIYIRLRGIVYLTKHLTDRSVKSPEVQNTMYQIARNTLRTHEFFHFLSEWGASFLELYSKKPLYKNYAKLAINKQYREYTIYVEEALANALAYQKTPMIARTKIKSFFLKQPDGYKDFRPYIKARKFSEGKRKLGRVVAYPDISELVLKKLINEESQFELLFGEHYASILFPEIPIYVVREPKHKSSFLRVLIRYSDGKVAAYPGDHPPPHIHVYIPPTSRRCFKLLYPSLEPYKGYLPLPKKKLKRLKKFIVMKKEKFDRVFQRRI